MKAVYLISLLVQLSTAFQLGSMPNRSCKTSLKSQVKLMDDGNNIDFDRRSLLSSGVSLASSVLLVVGAPTRALADDNQQAATYAYRSGGLPSLRPIGLTKLTTRYEGYVEAPKGFAQSGVPISFEFPSDWLQLDKLGGGVQYVDQRNGDKLYVLKATLPADTNLKTVPKSWFADVILSPEGDVARSGVVAEGGRISRSQMTVDCTAEDAPNPCAARRRMILKYDTVTGSGVQTVERRGLIDAYQVENDVYMMVTSQMQSNLSRRGLEKEILLRIFAIRSRLVTQH
jgi:hypothetical protein